MAPAPAPAPVVAAPKFKRLHMSWVGWDGGEWDITDPQSGVFLTQGGVRGLDAVTPAPWSSSSPALDGSRYRGERIPERECFWSLYVYSDESSQEWLERDRAFWRTMRRGKVGRWTVQTPDGTQRWLDLRFTEVDQGFERDPVAFGWHLYGVRLTAWQPYWAGELVTRSFANEPPVPFYASEHVSPDPGSLFYISSGSTLALAAIDNPGDVDAYPIFVFDGPWEAGASAGIGSDVTVYGASVAAGKSVVIDTRPDRLGAKQIDTPTADVGSDAWLVAVEADGVDVFTSLSSLASSVVPSGEDAPLAISATGQGSVHVAVLPLYERAW
jgi:hypothetical protein